MVNAKRTLHYLKIIDTEAKPRFPLLLGKGERGFHCYWVKEREVSIVIG